MRCQWLAKRNDIVHNLLSVYKQALPVDIIDGRAWYPNAHKIVCEWSNGYEMSIATVASVVSAISPQCDWPRNLVIADEVLADRPVVTGGALPANVRKARRLRTLGMSGADMPTEMLRAFPYGPKVNSFAQNLAGNDDFVTIDTHCIQAALNNVQSTLTLKWTAYRVFAECYERAARQTGERNSHFQSIVWHVWKRLYPRERKRVIRRQWDVIGEY